MAKILLVDDDPEILKVAEKVLAHANYQTETASDALIALDALNSSRFDALITDANMPRYSGFQLIQTVRNDKRFDHMAFIKRRPPVSVFEPGPYEMMTSIFFSGYSAKAAVPVRASASAVTIGVSFMFSSLG